MTTEIGDEKTTTMEIQKGAVHFCNRYSMVLGFRVWFYNRT